MRFFPTFWSLPNENFIEGNLHSDILRLRLVVWLEHFMLFHKVLTMKCTVSRTWEEGWANREHGGLSHSSSHISLTFHISLASTFKLLIFVDFYLLRCGNIKK